MAVTIGEIVTETVVAGPAQAPPPLAGSDMNVDVDMIVRRAAERVLEILRREWDR